MPRRQCVFVLFVLLLASSTACAGLDAARNAGEGARGDGGEDRAEPPSEIPGKSGGEEEAQESAMEMEETTESPAAMVLDPKWYKDSDANYVPDFIEIENGFDPSRDDCVPEECPGAAGGSSVEFVTSERNALLILDSSGSMSADAGTGQTKMEVAKAALSRYAGPSSVLFETGFAVFGHTGDSTEAGKAQSCETAAETLLPLGEMDPQTFDDTLSQFQPTGWTPIEGALDEAESVFSGKEGQVNRVILVSDGIETCGGDPVAAAERLHTAGIEVQIDVVGFGVPGDEADQLRAIATAGGGEYFDAQTGADLDEFFKQQSEAISQTLDAFDCEQRNGLFDTICDQNLCNDATVFTIPDEQNRVGRDSPEYDALQELSERISAGLDERQEARDEASDRAEELRQQYLELQEEYNRIYQQAYGTGS